MDTGSTSAYVGACRKDIPYPSVSHESVPSLIDNLVTALYGTITKQVVNRRVQWTIPCDPASAPATVFGIPRNDGEGLLCYFIRAFNTVGTGGATFYGNFVGPLTGNVTGNMTGNVTGNASGLAGGTTNSVHYQSAPNVTSFLPAGINGQVLGILSTGLSWVSAPAASTSSAIVGGAAGQVLWQTGSGATGFTAAGTTGQVLSSNGTSTPTWINASSSNTASAIVQRDGSGNFSAGTITAALTGNASTSTKLASTKTIATSGDVTGTATAFDGSANISIPTSIATGSVTPSKLSTGAPSWDAIGNLTATSFNGTLNGTASAIADGAVSTTAKLANGIVTAAKLGTNEQKQICKAWVNFDGTLIGSSNSNMATGQNITVTAGSNLGTFQNTSTWPANYVGTIFAIPSIGGVSNATLGGVNVTSIGVQFVSVSGTNATIKLLAGNATSSQTISGNGTSSGWTYINTGIRSYYNVSSITKNATGDYTTNFATAMADANYSVSSISSQSAVSNNFMSFSNTATPQTTASVRLVNVNTSTSAVDSAIISVQVFGN